MVADPSSAFGRAHREHLPEQVKRTGRRAALLLKIAEVLAKDLGLDPQALLKSRLKLLAEGAQEVPEALLNLAREYALSWDEAFGDAQRSPGERALRSALHSAHRLGEALDLLRAYEVSQERRRLGSYYTPPVVARTLLLRASEAPFLKRKLKQGPLFVLDPACGGGAFLLEAASLCASSEAGRTRTEVAACVCGTDLSAEAVYVAEIALWLWTKDPQAPVSRPRQFLVGDALTSLNGETAFAKELKEDQAPAGIRYEAEFPEIFARGGSFDWVVGNPPWVAFQGRATQPISAERRAFYRKHYRAFSGYPTLHGLFVERATQLARGGMLSLLLPSSVSDLEGYQSTRRVVREGHIPLEPMEEFGQDAFSGVVQPCFGLLAEPRTQKAEFRSADEAGARFLLEERTHQGRATPKLEPPAILETLMRGPSLPREIFREMGFQSNRVVATELFLRAERPEPPFIVPLLEGKNVSEFEQRQPRLFLYPDREILSRTGCRLRAEEDYRAVAFVVRQTAAFTIAARHGGERFRNSLLAGFSTEELDADLLVGLLNSALYRALHVSRQRDARQAAFPQVKIAHLRSLPLPPQNRAARNSVRALSQEASREGTVTMALRQKLDRAVFELFDIDAEDQSRVISYLKSVAPRARSGGSASQS